MASIRAARFASGVRSVSTRAAGLTSQVTAVLGSQWGDEGKGKLADILAKHHDIVARFNGGANAGHTVVVGDQKFAFHLLPCGLIHPHTKNLLGNGTVIHLPSLFSELEPLSSAGIEWKGRLLISDRATLLFDFHKQVDGLLEERRKQKAAAGGEGGAIGTTKQGIGPAYASKASRTSVRAGHLLLPRASLQERVKRLAEETLTLYGSSGLVLDPQAEWEKVDAWAERAAPLVTDGQALIAAALQDGKKIIAEGANAALLDLDFGTFPYVTSSSTTAGGICTGLGIPPSRLGAPTKGSGGGAVIGVVKAYTTRVGGGPFPTELTDSRGGGEKPLNSEGTEIGLHLQTVGREVGVTTGRKRRCGWFDAAVVSFAHSLNAFSSLNITKLDCLDDLETIKIATGYKLPNGNMLRKGSFPSTLEELAGVEVQYETLPGWRTSTRGITKFADLPSNAKAYIKAIEQHTGVPVAYIGTGPGREEMITRGFKLE